MHSHKFSLTVGLMIKPPLRVCRNKLENYIEDYIEKGLHLKYMLKVETVTKSF